VRQYIASRETTSAAADNFSRQTSLVGTLRRDFFMSKKGAVPRSYQWPVPRLETPTTLADWLAIAPNELEWFADLQSRERNVPAGPLRHYHYRRQRKRSGADRVIEVPKPRLMALQRRILREILEQMPVHDAAHGFRRGRSIKTVVEPHLGQTVVLKMDLKDFFPTISRARVSALFCRAGYPERVARLLAGLCCNSVPADIWEPASDDDEIQPVSRTFWRTPELYRRPHLPQGAPSSPALANLSAYRLDCRLAALAHHCSATLHALRRRPDLFWRRRAGPIGEALSCLRRLDCLGRRFPAPLSQNSHHAPCRSTAPSRASLSINIPTSPATNTTN